METKMETKEVFLLNTSILPNFGVYRFEQIELRDVLRVLTVTPYKSYIGHEDTAKIMEKLIGRPIPVNRESLQMLVGDVAIIFKLKSRIPVGVELTESEINQIGYEWGMLERLS